MKNVYEPDQEDIKEWLNEVPCKWPEASWDYYVMNGKNDELVFNLANDINCKEQDFFIHCLYYFVGDYFNAKKKNKEKLNRINILLGKAEKSTSIGIQKWLKETNKLLQDKMVFDTKYWLHFMFFETKKGDNELID